MRASSSANARRTSSPPAADRKSIASIARSRSRSAARSRRRLSTPSMERARRRRRASCSTSRERLVVGRSSRPHRVDDRAALGFIGGLRDEDRRLALHGEDVLADPGEVLARLRRVRQHVDRVAQRHGADLLQPPPGLDARVRRPRRKLMDEQQPVAARCGRTPTPLGRSSPTTSPACA
jgi:hypothetical protein